MPDLSELREALRKAILGPPLPVSLEEAFRRAEAVLDEALGQKATLEPRAPQVAPGLPQRPGGPR